MVSKKKELCIDLGTTPEKLTEKWRWGTSTVDSAEATNVVQFLKPVERIHFVNELYRVLKAGGKASIITPHWASNRAYSDLAFEWPPVVEQWFFHLNAEWRSTNNPKEKRYRCDFDVAWGYGLHPIIVSRNQEYQQHAVTFWKEAAQDLVATLTKR